MINLSNVPKFSDEEIKRMLSSKMECFLVMHKDAMRMILKAFYEASDDCRFNHGGGCSHPTYQLVCHYTKCPLVHGE